MPEIIEGNLEDIFKGFEVIGDMTNKTPELDATKSVNSIIAESTDMEALQRELEGNTEDKSKDENKQEEDKGTQEEVKVVEEESNSEQSSNSDDDIDMTPVINVFAESGLLDLEEGEEIQKSPEFLIEKYEATLAKKVQSAVDQYKESVPELGKQFLDYLEKGGDPKKFIEIEAQGVDLSDVDLSNEDDQELIVSEYLRSQDYTEDEIADTIKDYKDGLILEKQAATAAKKLEKVNESKRAELVKQQELVRKAQEDEAKEYVSTVSNFINGATNIAGLQIEATEKKAFQDYLFKRDKEGLTGYQRDIAEDPTKTQIELAYIKYKKYDFAKVAKKAESSAAAKFREAIKTKNENTVKGATGNESTVSDFSAFKSFKVRK